MGLPSSSSSSSSSSTTPLAVTALVVAATSVASYLYYQKKKKQAPLTVAALYVYPVKSAAPAPVKSGKLTATSLGFLNDRVYQVVVRQSGSGSGSNSKYEFCTSRNARYENLFKIQPLIKEDGKDSDNGSTTITLTAPSITKKTIDIPPTNSSSKIITTAVMCGPDVQAVDCGDAVALWLDQVLLGSKAAAAAATATTTTTTCRLVSLSTAVYQRRVVVNPDQGEALPPPSSQHQQDSAVVSFADEAAYHLATMSSLNDLNKRLKKRGKPTVPIERFRPNILLQGGSGTGTGTGTGINGRPWVEDTWKRIRIGGKAEFHVWQRTGRCTMTTIDRQTLKRGPEPLATLSEFRERSHGQRNFGMHLVAVPETLLEKENNGKERGGGVSIQIGDHVEVLEYNDERKEEWENLFG